MITCSGRSRGGAQGAHPPPLIFRPNWGPKGRKKMFLETAPAPPFISRSGWPSPPYLRASIRHWIDSVHLWAVVAKTQTNLDWHLTLYLRMKLKKPVLGMFTVNWSTVGEGPLVPSARTTPTTRTLWPAVLMIVVWLILFVGGCKGTKIIQKGKNIKNHCCHKSGAAGL